MLGLTGGAEVRLIRSRPKRAWVVAAALAVTILAAGCSSAPPSAQQPGTVQHHQIVTLDNISTLRSLFNRDDGHTRLVLIFSPT